MTTIKSVAWLTLGKAQLVVDLPAESNHFCTHHNDFLVYRWHSQHTECPRRHEDHECHCCDAVSIHNTSSTSSSLSLFKKQVAQLLQRDCAAGRVSNGQKWKTGTGRQYFTDIIDLSSTTVMYLASKAIEFREKNAKIRAITPFKVIQGHRDRYQSKACMRLPISD